MVKVSYIVPVYNKAPYLKACLDSIIAQHGSFSKEIIFVDDGSTDGSYVILQNMTKDLSNCKIIQQKNQGPSIACHQGALHSSGNYLRFIDADDLLHPLATEYLLKAIISGHVASSLDIHLHDNDTDTLTRHTLSTPFFKIKHHKRSIIHTTSSTVMLMTREAYDHVNGFDRRIFVQDYSLPLRLGRLYDTYQVEAPLYFHRIGVTSQLSHYKYQQHHGASLATAFLIKDYPEMNLTFKKFALQKAIQRVCRLYRKEHLWQNWFKSLLKAGHKYIMPPPQYEDEIFIQCEEMRLISPYKIRCIP